MEAEQLVIKEAAVAEDARLLIPDNDTPAPELSVVIPALNEEQTIAAFIDWCHQGIREAGVAAEILIIDSSTDRTAEIAVSKGARVLCVPRRGLGRAYIDSLPFIRGRYVLLGDSDCTYDFRVLKPWVECFRQGYEFIMGSRFRGTMEPDAMPKLHRYFGTPLMTYALNLLYGTNFSDIHCGMRGITLDGFRRMHLRSHSWEYASEMIVKSHHLRLRTAELPINFLRDQQGRVSHHKRLGWQSPWIAGWINMREIFTYCADVFAFFPGAVCSTAGIGLLCASLVADLTAFQSATMAIAGALLAVFGMGVFCLGAVAKLLYDFTGVVSRRWSRRFTYNKMIFACVASFIAGLALCFVAKPDQLFLDPTNDAGNLASLQSLLWGLVLLAFSFFNFIAALLLHAAALIRFKPTD